MSQAIEGGCRCGRVRYRANLERLPKVYACHCRNCQTWSGSAFSLQFVLVEDALEVSGAPALFEMITPSGGVSRQRGCPVCFSRVYNTNSARPGLAVVRAGTLDRSDEARRSPPTSGPSESWPALRSRRTCRAGPRAPRRRSSPHS